MRKKQLLTALALLGSTALLSAADVVIDYTLSGNTYTYNVENNSLAAGVSFFDIFFNVDFTPNNFDYNSITASAVPAGWTGTQYQPSAVDLGGIVEFSGPAIPSASSLTGFDATFNYTGSPTPGPGSQFFEVFDPTTFDVLASGWTAPATPPPPSVPDQCTWLSYLFAGLTLGAMRLRVWRARRGL
jgi:hypothetical protein